MIKQHKLGCQANIHCAVYHPDGICPGPYGVCTCDEIPTTPQEPISEEKKCEHNHSIEYRDNERQGLQCEYCLDVKVSPEPPTNEKKFRNGCWCEDCIKAPTQDSTLMKKCKKHGGVSQECPDCMIESSQDSWKEDKTVMDKLKDIIAVEIPRQKVLESIVYQMINEARQEERKSILEKLKKEIEGMKKEEHEMTHDCINANNGCFIEGCENVAVNAALSEVTELLKEELQENG